MFMRKSHLLGNQIIFERKKVLFVASTLPLTLSIAPLNPINKSRIANNVSPWVSEAADHHHLLLIRLIFRNVFETKNSCVLLNLNDSKNEACDFEAKMLRFRRGAHHLKVCI